MIIGPRESKFTPQYNRSKAYPSTVEDNGAPDDLPQEKSNQTGNERVYKPYLLRGLDITRAGQVWCTHITYVPMRNGYMYLTAIIDGYSRKIVGWGIRNSLIAQRCKTVLEEAISKYGKPEIVNSDQGTQYTSALWAQYLERMAIKISMDGKGRALDNIWIERFWKSIK